MTVNSNNIECIKFPGFIVSGIKWENSYSRGRRWTYTLFFPSSRDVQPFLKEIDGNFIVSHFSEVPYADTKDFGLKLEIETYFDEEFYKILDQYNKKEKLKAIKEL